MPSAVRTATVPASMTATAAVHARRDPGELATFPILTDPLSCLSHALSGFFSRLLANGPTILACITHHGSTIFPVCPELGPLLWRELAPRLGPCLPPTCRGPIGAVGQGHAWNGEGGDDRDEKMLHKCSSMVKPVCFPIQTT